MPHVSVSPALRRRLLLCVWCVLALAPVAYIATEAAAASRNFPFWDEIDSAVDFMLQLQGSPHWSDIIPRLFALNNEHRTVTSRLLFAASYWLTGTVNFHLIGLIGNLFIVGACGLLLRLARDGAARIRLAVILGLLVFQLENYENFIWSGASIDHFQVVLLALAALAAVSRDTRGGCVLGAVLAVLATFTLAHGCVVWPLGAAWLVHRRAWRRLLGWSAVGAVALAGFFHGFEFNPGHHIPALSLDAVFLVGGFWLQLLGAPLALGDRGFALLPGLVLLVLFAVLLARRVHERHPLPMLTAWFGICSLVLVAFGRIHTEADTVTSRYMILSVLAWAMVLHVLLEEAATPERPFRWLAVVAPALIGLSVTADVVFQVRKEAFIEVRDRAATFYKAFGHTGTGISAMYPQPRRADAVLAAAYDRGVYHLGRVSDRVEFPGAKPSDRIITYVDELITNDRALTVGGWAMIPGRVSKRGHVYVVLQSDREFLVYSALTLQRPDVARAYQRPEWRLCGFRAVIGRGRVPADKFRVGVLIADADGAEYTLTKNAVVLNDGPTPNGQLASSH